MTFPRLRNHNSQRKLIKTTAWHVCMRRCSLKRTDFVSVKCTEKKASPSSYCVTVELFFMFEGSKAL